MHTVYFYTQNKNIIDFLDTEIFIFNQLGIVEDNDALKKYSG